MTMYIGSQKSPFQMFSYPVGLTICGEKTKLKREKLPLNKSR